MKKKPKVQLPYVKKIQRGSDILYCGHIDSEPSVFTYVHTLDTESSLTV